MKTANIMKVVCAAGLSAACLWGLAACSGSNASNSTGAVAATVNGAEIPEDKVTAMIESIRSQMGATDEDTWGQWLADNKMTPDSVRKEMIDSFVGEEISKQGAQDKGIQVDDSDVDKIVDKMKSNYDSDDKWQAALKQAGFTEDEYRQNIKDELTKSKFQETFATDEEPSQDDLMQYAKMYASAYDGAKRSSHILFDANDEDTAKSVLEQIKSGQLDFADAAKQYSKDDASASKGGDVGWDKLNKFVKEYTDALSGLDKGQISDLVKSNYGYHIIKCTDVFTAPKDLTSLDQIPPEFLDNIKASLKKQKQNEAYQSWLDDQKSKADIKINDMPQNLPYDVDMSKYTPATGSDQSGAGNGTSTNGGQATSGDQSNGDQSSGQANGDQTNTDQTGNGAQATDGSQSAGSQDATTGDGSGADGDKPAGADPNAQQPAAAN